MEFILTRIIHATSVHARYDVRIFLKECISLARISQYDVHLIVADGRGDEEIEGIKIHDVGKPKSRISRIFKTTRQVFVKAIRLEGDVYHMHDPELLPLGLKLKMNGKKVLFDSHEDVAEDILSKEWIPFLARRWIAILYSWYEKKVCQTLDGIIGATPFIRDKFLKINDNSVSINNFPLLNEVVDVVRWEEKKDTVCYIGGIATIRGVKELVKAMEHLDEVQLNLVGSFNDVFLQAEVQTYNGWHKVNALGFLDRFNVGKIMRDSKVGIVTFYPVPNHIDAQPNKMFEYMSAGIPVIASDFPLWKEIIEGNHCGLCVNPLNPDEIAKAINDVMKNSDKAQEMGQNGLKAIKERYNWEIEEEKLFNFYARLIES